MKIEVRQPHPDYPFAWALVEKVEAPSSHAAVNKVLARRGITVLGPWEHTELFFRAPCLLELEYPDFMRSNQ